MVTYILKFFLYLCITKGLIFYNYKTFKQKTNLNCPLYILEIKFINLKKKSLRVVDSSSHLNSLSFLNRYDLIKDKETEEERKKNINS